MSARGASGPLYLVRCEQYATKPKPLGAAERELAHIVELGACSGAHEVVPAAAAGSDSE